MRATLSRIFCLCMLGVLAPSVVAAASVPDGATIRVNAFTFPQAAYTGAEEESQQLSAEFRNELVSALQQAGLVPAVSSKVKDEEEKEEAAQEKQEEAKHAKTPKKERSAEETIADEEADLFTDKYTDEEDGIIDDGAAEKDELMAVVEEAERAEKEREDNEQDQEEKAEISGAKSSGKSGAYVITGTVTQYEEQVGAPVSTGKTKRSRAEVTLTCTYQVKNPAGKVIISEKTSASSSRIVAETVDIHAALQNLKKKAFFEASHNIAERVSGKTRVKAKDDAEPGSEEDEYADSPGKRLKSGSKSKQRMKWTIN